MKRRPRIVVTTKILAVALTAAGCAPTSGSSLSQEPQNPGAASVVLPEPIAEPQAAAPIPTALSPVPAAPPAVLPAALAAETAARPTAPAAESAALVSLRDELDAAGPEGARARAAHFRPLCDSDGYPLVGNLARKGPSYGPSAFCKSLREPLAKR